MQTNILGIRDVAVVGVMDEGVVGSAMAVVAAVCGWAVACDAVVLDVVGVSVVVSVCVIVVVSVGEIGVTVVASVDEIRVTVVVSVDEIGETVFASVKEGVVASEDTANTVNTSAVDVGGNGVMAGNGVDGVKPKDICVLLLHLSLQKSSSQQFGGQSPISERVWIVLHA